MLDHCIVYTRPGGAVSYYKPYPSTMRMLTLGGGYWQTTRGYRDEQIGRQVAAGISPDIARRFADAATFGGCTTAEAWAQLRDRDCARHGTAHELVLLADLPHRWFRDAWRRSANGGPIEVDLVKARAIQFSRIVDAVNAENARRSRTLGAPRALRFSRGAFERYVMNARDDDELMRVWPEDLERKAS